MTIYIHLPCTLNLYIFSPPRWTPNQLSTYNYGKACAVKSCYPFGSILNASPTSLVQPVDPCWRWEEFFRKFRFLQFLGDAGYCIMKIMGKLSLVKKMRCDTSRWIASKSAEISRDLYWFSCCHARITGFDLHSSSVDDVDTLAIIPF